MPSQMLTQGIGRGNFLHVAADVEIPMRCNSKRPGKFVEHKLKIPWFCMVLCGTKCKPVFSRRAKLWFMFVGRRCLQSDVVCMSYYIVPRSVVREGQIINRAHSFWLSCFALFLRSALDSTVLPVFQGSIRKRDWNAASTVDTHMVTVRHGTEKRIKFNPMKDFSHVSPAIHNGWFKAHHRFESSHSMIESRYMTC